ncbi:MAG TPA: protein translocase subunit SecD, partial [Actinomycetes bacterium]|nr:protein translocase subunit SecD [Actinomycetes bacterium]
MATQASTRPGRSLLVLAVIIIVLGAWMLIAGVHTPRLGLDLRGGTSVTLQPKLAPGETGQITSDSINQAVTIIQQRVNGSGVAEAEVTAQGSGNNAVIVVSVPGVAEGKLVETLGQTASLSFRPVLAEAAGVATPTQTPTPTPTPSGTKKQGGKNNTQAQSNGAVLPRVAGDNSSSPKPTDKSTQAATPTPTPTGTATAPLTTPPSATGQASITPEMQRQFQKLDCSDPKQRNIGSKYKASENA